MDRQVQKNKTDKLKFDAQFYLETYTYIKKELYLEYSAIKTFYNNNCFWKMLMNPFVIHQFCLRSMRDGRTVTDEHKNT